MKATLISAMLFITTGVSAYGETASQSSDSVVEATCCQEVSSENRQIILSYLDKLKDAYLSQDQGFLMSILDVDRDELTDLYNEFMDEDVDKAGIEDVVVTQICESPKKIKTSFKLTREGYNFSDSKNVTILWEISDPHHPKITEVTTK
ncbi:MAG: hypothetical protein NC127_04110 [Muribaculum sp.]|nr:hypothetical protein [Muribaculum sp.]